MTLVLLIVCHVSGLAQTEKGSFMVGGAMSLSASKDEHATAGSDNDYKSFSFSLSPDVAYFPVANLAIGLAMPVSYTSSSSPLDETKSRSYSVGSMLRYYIRFGKWAVFPELRFARGWRKTKGNFYDAGMGEVIEYTSKGKATRFSGGAGITYFITRDVGLEALLSYQSTSGNSGLLNLIDTHGNSVNFNVGFQIYLGRNE